MNTLHTAWQQGYFVDQIKYRKWTDEEKRKADERERLLVRPSSTGNAICQCNTPGEAKWIAGRLNLAARLEQMAYDFATGKTDGSDIIKMVQKAINS